MNHEQFLQSYIIARAGRLETIDAELVVASAERAWRKIADFCKADHLESVDQKTSEIARLKSIIRRASTTFCTDGPDGQIAADMFEILCEAERNDKF